MYFYVYIYFRIHIIYIYVYVYIYIYTHIYIHTYICFFDKHMRVVPKCSMFGTAIHSKGRHMQLGDEASAGARYMSLFGNPHPERAEVET